MISLRSIPGLPKFARLAVLVLFIPACATGPDAPKKGALYVNALVIMNKTDDVINEVKIKVLDTHRYITCNVILAHTACSLGFKKVNLETHPTTIAWIDRGRSYERPVRASNMPSGNTLTVHVDIYEDGRVNTYFR